MSKAKLPPATDWQARDINDWNTTSFRQYLYDRHRELYGLDYVGAVKRDCGMISGMIKQHDKATVKAFIDECFRQYKPTTQYSKYRTVFEKGALIVSLDETEAGNYLEVEGPSDEVIMEFGKQLGYTEGDYVRRTYAELIGEKKNLESRR